MIFYAFYTSFTYVYHSIDLYSYIFYVRQHSSIQSEHNKHYLPMFLLCLLFSSIHFYLHFLLCLIAWIFKVRTQPTLPFYVSLISIIFLFLLFSYFSYSLISIILLFLLFSYFYFSLQSVSILLFISTFIWSMFHSHIWIHTYINISNSMYTYNTVETYL